MCNGFCVDDVFEFENEIIALYVNKEAPQDVNTTDNSSNHLCNYDLRHCIKLFSFCYPLLCLRFLKMENLE